MSEARSISPSRATKMENKHAPRSSTLFPSLMRRELELHKQRCPLICRVDREIGREGRLDTNETIDLLETACSKEAFVDVAALVVDIWKPLQSQLHR